MDSLQPKPLNLKDKEKIKDKVPSVQIIEQFGEVLKEKLKEVNDLTNQADILATKMVTGEVDHLHDVMIAAEKANLAMQMAMQLKRVFIRAYNQLMMTGMR
jgi:flagellar hook-basal body complex protein FliE